MVIDQNSHVAGFVVKTLAYNIIADIFDRLPNDLLVENFRGTRDISHHTNIIPLGDCADIDLGLWVHIKAGVQNRLADVITELTAIPIADRFTAELKFCH